MLNKEEIFIIDTLLDRIPLDGKFSIFQLHCEFILKPQFHKGDGSIDLAQYDPARNDFTQREVYKRVNNFLINKELANIFDPIKKLAKIVDNNSELILTDYGKLLKVYGSYQNYQNASIKSTEEEIIARIPQVIGKAFPYGSFNLQLDTSILAANEYSDDQKIIIKNAYNQVGQEIEVIMYLIKEGFAINREDLSDKGKSFQQLTDRGRLLKECGSLQEFNRVNAIQESQKDLLNQTVVRNYYVNLCIAISTGVAAIYYIIEITKHHISNVNINILTTFFIFIAGMLSCGILILIVREINNNNKK